VSIKGKEQYLNKVKVTQDKEQLSVSTSLKNTSSPIRVTIGMPSLVNLTLSKTDDIHIAGFKENKLRIKGQGESRADIKAFLDVDNLELDLNSRMEVDIRGSGNKLTAHLSDRAELDAERFAVKTAKVEIKDRGSAQIAVSDTLRQILEDRGSVKVDGEPVVIKD